MKSLRNCFSSDKLQAHMASILVTTTSVYGWLPLARSYNVCVCGGRLQLPSHNYIYYIKWMELKNIFFDN